MATVYITLALSTIGRLVARFVDEPQLPSDFNLHLDLGLRAQRHFKVIPENASSPPSSALSDIRRYGDGRSLELRGQNEPFI